MSYHAKDEKPDDVMEDSGANYAKKMTKLYNILFESNEPEKKKLISYTTDLFLSF